MVSSDLCLWCVGGYSGVGSGGCVCVATGAVAADRHRPSRRPRLQRYREYVCTASPRGARSLTARPQGWDYPGVMIMMMTNRGGGGGGGGGGGDGGR
jgi:hypothetical protein